MKEENAKYDIEHLIDEVGYGQFMQLVEHICYEKSDHAMSAWSDPILSKIWEKQGDIINKVVTRWFQYLY